MLFTNAWIFQGEQGFRKGGFRAAGGRLRDFFWEEDGAKALVANPENAIAETMTDLKGLFVLPGLVDIHTHGNSGADFSDGSLEGLCRMGRNLARHGITSFLPTSMTLPYARLEAAFETASAYRQSRPEGGARVLGVHMEGPYFSKEKKGAQNVAYLRLPDIKGFLYLKKKSGSLVRIVDIAPELPGAEEFIRRIAPICRVSLGHTEASYETAARAFAAGATHVTHLFNGMPELMHREPSVAGAAFDKGDVTVELIADGLHVHPSVVRMIFRLFPGRVCLISDALRCCGMAEGEYELGGQKVFLTNAAARLGDGTLAGAVRNLFEDMVQAIRFGVPVPDAVLAATRTPAMAAGTEEIGSLEAGKRADFIVCDEEWNLLGVYMDGERIA